MIKFLRTKRSRIEKLGSQHYSPKRGDRHRGVSYKNTRLDKVQSAIINIAIVRRIAERLVSLIQENRSSQAWREVEILLDCIDSTLKVKLGWREGGICDTLYQDTYNFLKCFADNQVL